MNFQFQDSNTSDEESGKQNTRTIKFLNIPNKKSSQYISKSWSGSSVVRSIEENDRIDRMDKFSQYSGSSSDSVEISASPISPPKDIAGFPRSPNKHKSFTPFKHRYRSSSNDKSKLPYDPVANCKSAGIIPYTIHNDTLYFLFQKADNPSRKKDAGWNDFGGKQLDPKETTIDVAAREFSEETNCLFYLKENINTNSNKLYELLKNNENLFYDENAVDQLKKLIPESQKFYVNKISEFVIPLYINSKETYISYFVRVNYIPENDIPNAEDLHIFYEDRYTRECRWFTIDDIMQMSENEFHKRLQITKIQKRINNYHKKDLFT
jgi:hypothetical protein